MNAGWIDALCAVEEDDAPVLHGLLERHLDGREATCRGEQERLCVEFPTEADESLFRLHLLSDSTVGDISRIESRINFVSPRLSGRVRRLVEQGAFEAAVLPVTIVDLELNGEGAFRRLEAALLAARRSFPGQPPALWIV